MALIKLGLVVQAVGHPTGSLCWDVAAFPRDIPVCRLCHVKDAPICLE